jgi:hypothetical protein
MGFHLGYSLELSGECFKIFRPSCPSEKVHVETILQKKKKEKLLMWSQCG